jgi:hypothetical protein
MVEWSEHACARCGKEDPSIDGLAANPRKWYCSKECMLAVPKIEYRNDSIAQQQAIQLAKDCFQARAKKLRQFVIKGYKLSDLCLVQYIGFPVFHIENNKINQDGSHEVTCEDKFKIELVKHMTAEEKEEWKMRQRSSGLWYDFRGPRKKRSGEV